MDPAPREAIILLLTRLAAHFWSDKPEAQWRIVFEDYAEDLKDFPLDIIDEGLRAYRRKGKWWPKLAELVSEIEPLFQTRQVQRARLELIAGSRYAAEMDNPAMALVRAVAEKKSPDPQPPEESP